jgi:CxxC motif-containing protein (DUF1111 family)
MKLLDMIFSGCAPQPAVNKGSNGDRIFVLRCLFLLLFIYALASGRASGQAVDPGPRGGSVGAGSPVAGLSADQQRFFATALSQFTEIQGVQDPGPGNGGLGPTFNGNACAMCHSQPAIGGTSPSTSAYPFVGPNPQVAVATLMGATNTLPFFVTPDGPVREARLKYFYSSPGDGQFNFFGRTFGSPLDKDDPDGSVHDLFTIAGRSDAPGCVYPQEDFAKAQADGNLALRIPTPVFGVGLIENISDATILASLASTAARRAALGIGGVPNRSGNDFSITRLGWKAQNKSGLVFAGEAYSVEVGVTNEMFTNERGFGGVPPPASCIFNPTPEDTVIFLPDTTTPMDTSVVNSDIEDFSIVMRFLDQPTPACTGTGCSASIQDGVTQFAKVGCAMCHTPSMTTDASDFAPAALSGVQANLFSDLVLHHMGDGLADGISQGNAGPDQFRSSPLWGIGQRVFFLHDGRTSDLLQAIEDHASRGSEANTVIRFFNGLTVTQQQDLLNFLRSL